MLVKVAAGLILALRLYQLPVVQSHLSPSLRWKNWGLGMQLSVVFVVPMAAALLDGLAGGLAFSAALSTGMIAGAAAAVAAIGGDKLTKELGAAWDDGQRQLNPMHAPGALRKASSLVFPLAKSYRNF